MSGQVTDDDKTDRSWRELLLRLSVLMDFMEDCIAQNRRLLICCEVGISTCTSLLIAFLLFKRRIRIQESLDHIRDIRQQVRPSISMWKGLQAAEDGFDQKHLQSLEFRVKHSQLFDLEVL